MKRTMLIAVVVMGIVFGLVAYAGAATSGSVAVQATVNPQMEITVPGATQVMAGGIDPLNPNSVSFTVSGKSNKNAFLTAVVTEGTFTTLTSTVGTADAWGKGGNLSKLDTVDGTVDWAVDAGTVVAGSVLYTISQ